MCLQTYCLGMHCGPFCGQGREFYWAQVFLHWSDGASTTAAYTSVPSGHVISGVIGSVVFSVLNYTLSSRVHSACKHFHRKVIFFLVGSDVSVPWSV